MAGKLNKRGTETKVSIPELSISEKKNQNYKKNINTLKSPLETNTNIYSIKMSE